MINKSSRSSEKKSRGLFGLPTALVTQSIWSVHGRANPTKAKEAKYLPALTEFHHVPALLSLLISAYNY
jgi:hypothetical protein